MADESKVITRVIHGAASEKHAQQMLDLAELVDAERVDYEDLGSGENYTLHKGGETLTLAVRGNRADGAFLSVRRDKPRPVKVEVITPGDCRRSALKVIRECAATLKRKGQALGILRSLNATQASSLLHGLAEGLELACGGAEVEWALPKETKDDDTGTPEG